MKTYIPLLSSAIALEQTRIHKSFNHYSFVGCEEPDFFDRMESRIAQIRNALSLEKHIGQSSSENIKVNARMKKLINKKKFT